MRSVIIIIAALLALAIAAPAAAQDALCSWGLSGSSTARAWGLEAAGMNPAHLALYPDGGSSVGLASLGFDLGNNALSLDRYNEISGAVLDEQDKQQLLAEFPEGGLRIDAGLDASLLGARFGRYALSSHVIGRGSGTLDRDVFELVLLGNEIDQAFSFDDTDAEGYALAAATFSFGVPLYAGERLRLGAGANWSYLRGLYYSSLDEATGGLVTTFDGLQGSARALMTTAEGGSGYSADLGLAAELDGRWRFGLMLESLLGSVTWKSGVERHLWTAEADSVLLGQEDIEDAVVRADSTWSVDRASSSLPRVLTLGIQREWSRLTLALDGSVLMGEGTGRGEGASALLGAEWKALSWLRPRLGLGLGRQEGAVAGLGLRLGALHLNFMGGTRNGYLPGGSRGMVLGGSLGLRF